MPTRLLYRLLGLPPTIDYSRLKPFDDTPPKVVVHKRNIPVSLISLGIAAVIYMFITRTTFLQEASTATEAWFNDLAKFMSESPLIEITIRVIGFLFNFTLLWVIPLAACLIAALRSVLEMFPNIKNHRSLPTD